MPTCFLPPVVLVVGDTDHADFRDVTELLRAEVRLVNTTDVSPELIIFVQSRTGSVDRQSMEAMRRSTPLAGIVVIAGSWCEGEPRTGRPWPGVQRIYWYEFPAWWQRQLALCAAGLCPDWLRQDEWQFRGAAPVRKLGDSRHRPGVVLLRTSDRTTADALADVLHRAGYASIRELPGRAKASVRGAIAGIWDGGQLNDCEANDLSRFCRRLANDNAPAVAILDFPRRDRVEHAVQSGAFTVLGKPWVNAELIGVLYKAVEATMVRRAA